MSDEHCDDCGGELERAGVHRLGACDANAELRRCQIERDLAVAHDRQPYPTAQAYEKACAALNRHRVALQTLVDWTRDYAMRNDWGEYPQALIDAEDVLYARAVESR